MLGLEIVLAIIGISGVWLTGERNHWGWVVGICYQVLWIVYAVFTAQYAFIIVCLVYAWVYAKAFMKWRQSD